MNFAAIAQQVERILGKDEVSSSNLDSSSRKASTPLGVGAFLLFEYVFELETSHAKRVIIGCRRAAAKRQALSSSNLDSSSKSLENIIFSRLFTFPEKV